MRALSIAALAIVVIGTGAAVADVICVDSGFEHSCVINNGAAPPTPDNVIDDDRYDWPLRTHVRNVGCPDDWGDAGVRGEALCTSPGEPTEVDVVDGALVYSLAARDSSLVTAAGGTVTWLRAYDSSDTTLDGGLVSGVWAYDSAVINMSEGTVATDLIASDSSVVMVAGGSIDRDLSAKGSSHVTMSDGVVARYLISAESPTIELSGGWVSELWAGGASIVTMSGGTVWGQLTATDSSSVTLRGGSVRIGVGAASDSAITIEGSEFEVDGVSVPYGDLAAQTGTLSGTLASGESLDIFFYQGQGAGQYYTGTITLVEAVPEPTTATLRACALLALALLRIRSLRP